ncbi:MAG TPA: phosphoglucosamine mutase [Vicinamibacterales bacterium]|nr:phosphoglucosamine mutase [Vicinamibacterales bacterium]
MADHLFGTDGIRGKAGQPPLDRATVRRVGAALVRALRADDPLRLLTGRDTRESGAWIERELAWGAAQQGARVASAGVVPTPAVAYLARTGGYGAGVMISASHNPFDDNGIKIFSGSGEKFTEELERHVEAIVADPAWQLPDGDAPDVPAVDLVDRYLAHLRAILPDPGRLGRLRLAVDCANGAMAAVAPRLFRELGFDVDGLACRPDGRNINLDCGSTHPQHLAGAVRADGYRLGVAFDGDGDRAIFVDRTGRVIDGDAILLLCATQMKAEGRLRGDAVVATVMSNVGLEVALRRIGVSLIRTSVGDKYVMEEMLKRGLSLGGEQSGHIIFSDYLFTGDGLCTALNVLRTMAATGRELDALAAGLVPYPQVLLNVRVGRKVELRTVPAVSAVLDRVERRLADRGRLLVRYSGTEPLLRVMLEGPDPDQIRRWGEEIVAAVREHLA